MQQIGFVLFEGFHIITFAAMAVFEVANKMLGEARYDVRLLRRTEALYDPRSEPWWKRNPFPKADWTR